MKRTIVTPEHRTALNAGQVETRHLADILAVDFAHLMRHVAPTAPPLLSEGSIVARMMQAGHFLKTQGGFEPADFGALATHPSDTVRGWACYGGLGFERTLAEHLAYIRPFADDPHFSVREWAWMALRPFLIADLPQALERLQPWTADPSERVRRFATEALRPRGVWCQHIRDLRNEPWRAMGILEPLHADPARYVQLSVANWLNDASKDHPTWVQDVCAQWECQSQSPHTTKICKRALRTVRKALK